jgi:hypothetical protein
VRYTASGSAARSATRSIPVDGLRHPAALIDRPPLRPPVRPLDDGTTESIRVIEFVWQTGARVQPVLWLERELLN